jgi:hypothetical protein
MDRLQCLKVFRQIVAEKVLGDSSHVSTQGLWWTRGSYAAARPSIWGGWALTLHLRFREFELDKANARLLMAGTRYR